MTKRRHVWLYGGLGVMLLVSLMGLLILGPRWLRTEPPATPLSEPPPPVDARKIRARLFFVNEEGTRLLSVEQEVGYGEGPVEQAKRILEAQIAPSPDQGRVGSSMSAIPAGTKLRSVFLTTAGDAYIDLSQEVQTNHPGGTTNEILTVYSLVSALTSNLPAITAVQILIDGKEVDTLAGHLDLRRPFEHDDRWIQE